MIKSPVEGSTAALIRLETPVSFSDYVRPICLPDAMKNQAQPVDNFLDPNTDLDIDTLSRSKKDEKFNMPLPENRDYFLGPDDSIAKDDEELSRKVRAIPPEYLNTSTNPPIRIEMNETSFEKESRNIEDTNKNPSTVSTEWIMCNTLGWSRQRDHLQRVQLKFSNMATCENISIATVNSMCTEAAFHKQDCTEEEYAGSPVMCILPNSKRWALVGIASWRIACAPNGIERPRMYDKITPNSAWIRHTINAT